MQNALIIFVRKPEYGKVKTRLAAVVGPEKALAIYTRLLEHTLSVVSGIQADMYIFATEPLHGSMWSNHRIELQTGDGLGTRMQHAFDLLFRRHYRKVLIIGSDCPALSSEHLQLAYSALDSYDVVIGPALDGGYYLLGMKELHEPIFENKNWSTSEVLTQTLETLHQEKLTFIQLEKLRDVDEEADLPDSWRSAFAG